MIIISAVISAIVIASLLLDRIYRQAHDEFDQDDFLNQ
jgi:hypothetical protein